MILALFIRQFCQVYDIGQKRIGFAKAIATKKSQPKGSNARRLGTINYKQKPKNQDSEFKNFFKNFKNAKNHKEDRVELKQNGKSLYNYHNVYIKNKKF